jgi:hypothetical protein
MRNAPDSVRASASIVLSSSNQSFAVRLTNPDGFPNLITTNPKRLAVAKGQTGSDSPQQLLASAKSLNGTYVDMLLDELIKQKLLDPRIVRALSRI